MQEEKALMFQNRLTKVSRHLDKQARRMGVSCYRIYDHDLPEFPFCIERYGEKLYVAEYQRRHGLSDMEREEWIEQSVRIISEVLKTEEQNIYTRLRKKKQGRLDQYQKLNEEDTTQKAEFIVQENGLNFLVNLTDYLDTGLFLDHRITRQMVREKSAGKKILNLFAYTGSFSVYAAAGGAAEVTTVDLSNTYLKWAQQNFKINELGNAEKNHFIQADVLTWLEKTNKESYDLIIMDPPTFSNSKRMKDFLDIQRDHPRLINDCLHALNSGGELYFSTNFTQFKMEGSKIDSSEIKDITRVTTPFDFEGKLNRFCFLIKKLG